MHTDCLLHNRFKKQEMKFDMAIIAYDEKENIAQKVELHNLSFIVMLGVLVGFPRKKHASITVAITASTEDSED